MTFLRQPRSARMARRKEYPRIEGLALARFWEESGLGFHINRRILNPLGYVEVYEHGLPVLIDRRERPDFVFSPKQFRLGKNRLGAHMAERGREVISKREFLLGFQVQPSPESLQRGA